MLMLLMLWQAAQTTAAAAGDADISCKWLLTAIGSALAGTNIFWALWVKSLLAENNALDKERVQDLKDTIKAGKG